MFETKTVGKSKSKVKNLKIENVHGKALIASREYLKAEHVLFEIVCELDKYDVASYYEFSSLYDYCLKALKLTEAVTCNMIAVARKSKQVPELKAAVMKGEVSVSTARKITPVISKENSQEWISKASTLTKAKLEKAVATVKPKEAIYDTAKYVSAEILEIKFGLDEKVMDKFKRAQDIVSQKTKSAASFEQTLDVILDFYLDKNDPLKKAERNVHKSKKESKPECHSPEQKARSNEPKGNMAEERDEPAKSTDKAAKTKDHATEDKDKAKEKHNVHQDNAINSQPVPGQVRDQGDAQTGFSELPKEEYENGKIPNSTQPALGQTQAKSQSQTTVTQPVPGQVSSPKRHIPAQTQHQVRLRDQDQCTHRNQHGDRCTNTRWLEVHHIQGFAQGSSHSLENLTTLCSRHHRQMHH